MKSASQEIPQNLIYEMVKGKAIYYKGYKEYLKGTKQLEEIMGSSKLQSFIATELIFLIRTLLGKDFYIFSNEIGLQFSKRSWRAADIAVIRKELVTKMDAKYLSTPPNFVVEIDTKADLSEINNPFGYYHEKTQELLKFGVQEIIWIFTDTKKVMIAKKSSKKWEILDWDQEIEMMDTIKVNIHELLKDNNLLA